MVLQGAILGLTYGLLALGLVLVYKSNRVLNFAHGQLGALSAVVLFKLTADYHAPYWPSLLLVLVMAVLIGGGCELVLRRLFDRPRVLVMVATIGLSQLLFVLTLLGPLDRKHATAAFPVPFTIKAHLGLTVFGPSDFAILALAPLMAIALALFFARSRYGLAVRAAAENAESARLGGIWVRRTSTVAWMIAGLLSAATAILVAPSRPRLGFAEALGPSLLVRALAAALFGGMIDLRTAFVAGVGVGVVEQVVRYNNAPLVEPAMYALLMIALLARAGRLRRDARREERSSWQAGAATRLPAHSADRRAVGGAATAVVLLVLALAPLSLSHAQAFLFTRIFVFAIVAISITILSGWAGQLSLGHFGLVAVGAIVAARWGAHLDLVLLLLLAGLITSAVAVVVGLPALRLRGLYLAVTTLGFAVVVSGWLLSERTIGLPDAASTKVSRPSLFGLDLHSDRVWYLFALAVVVVVVIVAHNLRRSGVGRAMIAVRDNEVAAGAMGLPVMLTKLGAFAISGFVAGIAGVLFAFTQQRFGAESFDPYQSIVVVSMVVIGGIGSIRGALLGAAYLLGLPALFGLTSSSATQTTVAFLTGGIGLMVFILYLPGGLAAVFDKAGDAVARLLAPAGPPLDPASATNSGNATNAAPAVEV